MVEEKSEHDRDVDGQGHVRRRAMTRRTGVRLAAAIVAGLVAGLFIAPLFGRSIAFDVMCGWLVAATVFASWTWAVVQGMNEHDAAAHAQEEDPSTAAAEVTIIGATVASLAGVGFLLSAASSKHNTPEAILGMASVVASWFLVHLTYVLRYARLYYGDGPGRHGIDFEGGEPDYYDFAYVAFDLGMTYQIADTNLTNRQTRRLVLGHMLLSYLLGVGVVATAINLVVSLASS